MPYEKQNALIQEINQESQKITPLYNNESLLFKELNTLNKAHLDNLYQKYKERLFNKQTKTASATNIIRFIIICLLQENKKISPTTVENLKQSFIRKDCSSFTSYLSSEIVSAIKNYDKKDPFEKLWDKSFSLLHPLVINTHIHDKLLLLTQSMLENLDLQTVCQAKAVDFTGSRNEGSSFAWFSLFPKEFKKHTQAYRLTATFSNGKINAFLDLGGEANSGKPSDFRNIHEASVSSYEELLGEFKNWKKEFLYSNNNLLHKTSLRSQGTQQFNTSLKVFKFPLNQILYGPPGTGKTYHTVTKAVEIIDGKVNPDYSLAKARFDELKKEGKIKFITFHQNYSYEDFMVGIRPMLNGEKIAYKLYEGPFKQIADKAREDTGSNYVLIIDEINRGNISKIFGELITLIEDDKRAGNDHAMSAPLLYQQAEFSVPNNLYIIGTMNTADKSIALVDIALRRRFAFEEMMPDESLLKPIEGFDLPGWFKRLNEKITAELDRDHQIGHSNFIKVTNKAELKQKFYQCILPLLKEYFYGNPEKLKAIIPGFEQEEQLDDEEFIKALNNILHDNTDNNPGMEED